MNAKSFLFIAYLMMIAEVKGEIRPISPKHLRISLKTTYQGSHIKHQWATVCERIGTAMSTGKGLWSFGIFKNYSCFLNKEKMQGSKKRKAEWHLDFIDNARLAELRLYYKPRGDHKRTILHRVILSPSPDNLLYLTDQEVTEILTWQLLDGLPMAGVIDITRKTFSYDDRFYRYEELPKPPNNLNIFKLSYDVSKKTFSKEIVGSAKLKKLKKKMNQSDILMTAKAKETPEKLLRKKPIKYRWKIKMNSRKFDPGRTYYIQDSGQMGANQRRIQEGYERSLSKFYQGGGFIKAAIFDTFSSGYTGFRGGISMITGDNLLSKAKLFGFITEIRDDFLKGLRLSIDYSPAISDTIDDQTYSFGWSRYSLGWSLGLTMSGTIKRIDFTPKIGILKFKADIPVKKFGSNSHLPTPFHLKNTSSLGSELSIEMINPVSLIRGWIASDFAGALDIYGNGRVDSLRGGLDTFIDVLEIAEGLEFAVMGFILAERINLELSVDDKEEPLEGRGEIPRRVKYDIVFIGSGVSITW